MSSEPYKINISSAARAAFCVIAVAGTLSASVADCNATRKGITTTNNPVGDTYISSITTAYIYDIGSDELTPSAGIPITIKQYDDDEYIVAFPEAEIIVSGETVAEAVSWLKSRIASSYSRFMSQKEKLGPVPAHQLQVLEKYLVKEQAA